MVQPTVRPPRAREVNVPEVVGTGCDVGDAAGGAVQAEDPVHAGAPGQQAVVDRAGGGTARGDGRSADEQGAAGDGRGT